MTIYDIFSLLGGLAMFLYGMHVMSSRLEKLSGGRFERILEKLTNNPVKGVIFGALVTAVMQSSSSTTVMVVGFVNSGIIKLSQAVGIIMGANIGTTITSWLLSLAGIEGDNIFINMLKPSSFSPLFLLVGVILIFASKKEIKKDVGSILVGFALLMWGMVIMTDAMTPLAEVPEFQELLVMSQNPVIGVVVGALFTALIQSSAASVGILQSLTVTGSVTYGAAIPIIMGQNIGTCIKAILSCIGANTNAKRAAMVHLYFNLIGTVLFLSAFYGANAIIDFAFVGQPITAAHIALIHSIFNVASTLILFPFAKLIEKLTIITIRDKTDNKVEEKEKKSNVPLLDERFLNTPSFAIEQCHNVTVDMAKLARKTLFDSLTLFDKFDETVAKQVNDDEQLIDEYEDILGTYLVKLSTKAISESDSREISKILHCIGDFERISDHAVNLLDAAKEMHDKKIEFSDDAKKEIGIMTNAVVEILNKATDSFVNNDFMLAHHVEPLEQVIDGMKDELKDRHIQRLQQGLCTIELGFVLTDILTNYERVSDHCSNIAVCVIQIKDSSFDTHEYLNIVKNSGEKEFESDFGNYKKKYALPERA